MDNFDIEKIEQYLKGQLSDVEQKTITHRMATEPNFSEAVALHQLTMQGIEQFGINQIQTQLIGIDKDLEEEGFFLSTDDIDDFLDEKLDPSTQSIMEKRLAKDAAFQSEVNLHKLTRAGIKKEAADSTFSDLFKDLDENLAAEGFFEKLDTPIQKIKEENQQKSAKIIRFPFQRLAIAASIVLAIFAGWWIFQPITPDSQVIYANNFAPLADELSVALEETGFVKEPYYDLLENGMQAYNAAKNQTNTTANYHQAKNYFIQYRQVAPTTDDFYPTASLYLAVSHLAIDEIPQAIALFLPLTQQNFSKQVDAQWYLALSYLKLEQTEKAIPILNNLTSTKYQENAISILKELQ